MLLFNINVNRKGKETDYPRNLPESWAEFIAQKHDALAALKLLLTLPETIAKIKILETILALPKSIFKALPDELVVDLVSKLDWLKPDISPIALLSHFDHQNVRYHLPKDNFQNGTALEFALADDYFKKASEGDESALLNLIATLCRPERTDKQAAITAGDLREPLNSRSEVEYRAAQLAQLDPSLQVAVYLYFAGCKKYISDLYGSYIFAKNEETEEEIEASQETQAQNAEPFGWWGVFMELAQNPINEDRIHQKNFHSLCVWLVRQKHQADKMRQATKKVEEV